jgi:hypothetical protein
MIRLLLFLLAFKILFVLLLSYNIPLTILWFYFQPCDKIQRLENPLQLWELYHTVLPCSTAATPLPELTVTTPACAAAFGPNPAGSIRPHPLPTPYHPQQPPPPVGAVGRGTDLPPPPPACSADAFPRSAPENVRDGGVSISTLLAFNRSTFRAGLPPSPPRSATPNFVIRFSMVSFSSSSCRLVRSNSL